MPDRRQFLTSLGGAAIGSALAFRPAPSGSGKPRTDPPNVFFLSIDDINDWIEHFQPGENTIAVAVLNRTVSSADLSFAAQIGTVPPV